MSSYPPPPPGTAYPPPYPPPYDRNAARNAARDQRRAFKLQARIQRAQVRAQIRAQRRTSIVGPLLLLAVGTIFLLAEFGKLSWAYSFAWFGRWWPAVLIAAGIVLLIEYALDQRRMADPSQPQVVRKLGGGVVFLLILVAALGLSSHFVADGMEWKEHTFGRGFNGLDHLMGDRHDSDDSVSSPIASGALLTVRNPHGDVTVTGSSTDGQIHVSIHKQVYAWSDSDIDSRERRLQPQFSSEGKDLVLTVPQVDGGQADLSIELPHTVAVTVQADRGNVTLSELHAAVTLSANHGDVDLDGITGPVSLHLNNDSSSLSIHSVTGAVLVEGRGGDVNVSDVTGPVTLQGDFFGTSHAEHINGVFRFQTSRTNFEVARLDGEFEIQGGPDLNASDMVGPVILTTRNRNITLDRVGGSVNITNRNGTINVTNAPALASIQIQNQKGSVDIGVPANAGFILNATTRNGDLENDFGITEQGTESSKHMQGTIAGGGPTINVTTTDGDVTVRKTTLTPLPPQAPTSTRITATPPPLHRPRHPRHPTPPKFPNPPNPQQPTPAPSRANLP